VVIRKALPEKKRTEGDLVDLALDDDERVDALVDVDDVVVGSLINDDRLVVLLVLDRPLVVIKGKLGGLSGGGSGGLGGSRGSRDLLLGNDAAGAEVGVLVRLLVVRDLLEARGKTVAVEGSKEPTLVG